MRQEGWRQEGWREEGWREEVFCWFPALNHSWRPRCLTVRPRDLPRTKSSRGGPPRTEPSLGGPLTNRIITWGIPHEQNHRVGDTHEQNHHVGDPPRTESSRGPCGGVRRGGVRRGGVRRCFCWFILGGKNQVPDPLSKSLYPRAKSFLAPGAKSLYNVWAQTLQ